MVIANTTSPVLAPYIRDADLAVRAPWRVPNRRLLDYLLVYILEGECRFIVDGVTWNCRSGQLCLIRPGQSVDLRGLTHTVTPYAHFDLFYNSFRRESFATRPGQTDLEAYRQLMQPGLESLCQVPLPALLPAPTDDWISAWVKIATGWRLGGPLERLQADQQLGVLFLELLREHLGRSGAAEAPAERRPLGWLASYLSTHLGDPISVEDMAERAGLSVSRFQVVFKETFGVSPARYLLELRVRHAGELLRATGWTLSHIAGLCGFSDVHHFAKTFRRLTGRTPGEHRRSAERTVSLKPSPQDVE